MKLWAKLYIDDKIIKDFVDDISKNFLQEFNDSLVKACYELDVGTPIILKKHVNDLEQYSSVVFLPSDFIEPVIFDKMIVQVY